MQAVQSDFNNMCCNQSLGKRNFKNTFLYRMLKEKKMEGGLQGVRGQSYYPYYFAKNDSIYGRKK